MKDLSQDPSPLATGPTKWRAEHCVTHHHACECREWEHACEIEKLEAERDALRARIDGAPAVALQLGGYGWLEMFDPVNGGLANLPGDMKGKRVRLVVEDGQ